MNIKLNRRSFISFATLSAGCSIQFIAPIDTAEIVSANQSSVVRLPSVGQSWTYHKFNCYNSQLLDVVRDEVVEVKEIIRIVRKSKNSLPLADEIQSKWGSFKQDSYWDPSQNYENSVPIWLNELHVGDRRGFDTYYFSDTSSFKYWLSGRISFVGWEKVKLSAGTFETMHFEKLIRLSQYDSFRMDTVRRDSIWIAPEVGRWVVRETNGEFRVPSGKGSSIRREDNFRWQLESWN